MFGPVSGLRELSPCGCHAEGLSLFRRKILENANFSLKFRTCFTFFLRILKKVIENFLNLDKILQPRTNLHKLLEEFDKSQANNIENDENFTLEGEVP